ncbi:MAG: MFS transporter [Negativicutes bacterium]|nr:MFS transporter [Negativicutes bacterium]
MAEQNISAAGTPERWKVLGTTFVAYVYDSYDIIILTVAMPVLLKLLNLSLSQGGLLVSATFIGGALGSILLGMIAENKGRRFALVLSMVAFGLGTGAIYLINTYAEWLILRFLCGIALGGLWGPCVAIISQHWSVKYRATAAGFVLSSFAIGGVIAALVGRLVFSYDWRLLFLTGSSAAIAAIYVWWATPDDSKDLKPVATGSDAGAEKVRLSEIFASETGRRTILGTMLQFLSHGGYWGIITWVPTYLVQVRHLSLNMMANFSFIMFFGTFLGYIGFAYLGDKIGRKKAFVACQIWVLITVPIYLLIEDATFLFWWSIVTGIGPAGAFTLMGAYFAELFPDRIRALAGGFCFNVGKLGGVVAPFTVGLIGQYYGLATGLIVAPIVFACGALVLYFLPETYRGSIASGSDRNEGMA